MAVYGPCPPSPPGPRVPALVGASSRPWRAHRVRGSTPEGTVGPLLQLTPTSGRATAPFTARYWYVDGSGAKCIFTTVDISWDGKKVASAKMDPPPRNRPTAA